MILDGITYSHEHIPIDLSEPKRNEDCHLDTFDDVLQEMKELYALGVRNIMDMTNYGMGRNIPYMERMARESKINIVAATGFYQQMFMPVQVFEKSVSQLADEMIRDIEEGIKGTSIKAGVIGEIATSQDLWTPEEEKVFKAAIIAQRETGTPISTHTSIGTLGHEQVHFFQRGQADLTHIVIGHVDLTGDSQYIIDMLKQGVNVEFDTIGKKNYMPEETRISMLKDIEQAGFTDQVLMSMDITRKSMLKKNGGNGYAYLLKDFVPLLKEHGISETFIQKMLVSNPKRIFGGETA